MPTDETNEKWVIRELHLKMRIPAYIVSDKYLSFMNGLLAGAAGITILYCALGLIGS